MIEKFFYIFLVVGFCYLWFDFSTVRSDRANEVEKILTNKPLK